MVIIHLVSASAIKSPISPFKPRQMSEKIFWRPSKTMPKLPNLHKWRAMMASKSWVQKAIYSISFKQSRQSAHRPMGRQSRKPYAFCPWSHQSGTRGGGEAFIITFRLSMIDLVPDGNTMDEVITIAKAIEKAGVTIINTGLAGMRRVSRPSSRRATRSVCRCDCWSQTPRDYSCDCCQPCQYARDCRAAASREPSWLGTKWRVRSWQTQTGWQKPV